MRATFCTHSTRETYPAIKRAPPTGVIGPSHLNLSRAKIRVMMLPEKREAPAAMAGPANLCTENRGWNETSINANPLKTA